MCPQTGMMCLRRYILVWQVEVLASCLVEALIIAPAKSNHQGQQSRCAWVGGILPWPTAAAAGRAGVGGSGLNGARSGMLK